MDVDVDVDIALFQNTPADAPSTQVAPSTAGPTRARTEPRRELTPRPTPRQSYAPAVSAAPATTPPNDDATPARFALSAGTVATGPAPPIRSATTGAGIPSVEQSTVGEGDVDRPARLVAAAPLGYPPAARQAEIELDFPVEIVVDATGRVVSARAAIHAGYGLDESAIRAIRDYRFSPAIRGGHPVAVRMRWTVQFRLR